MLYKLKKGNMQYLQQSVCKSIKDYDEFNKHAVIREILKKTELKVIFKDLQYLFNDTKYDCDIQYIS